MRWLSIVAAAGLLLAVPAGQESPASRRLAADMDRVRGELDAAPEAERAPVVARLDRAKAALGADRPLLALYLLEMPWEAAKAWTFVQASSGVTTAELFGKKWAAVGEPRQIASPSGAVRRPALLDALAAAADARGPTTYHASRFYGEDAGLAGGLYYLGESQAEMQFAGFVRGIEWPPAGTAPPLRSIANEIAALDVEMTTAYETMERANHSTYIVASAALKQARTLDERRQFGGALFQYLLSRYLFAPLRGPAAQDATTERIAEARQTLDQRLDNSIAELFLQLAGEGISGNVPAQHRGAAAALEDVIPAYLRAIAAPSLTAASAPPAQVTITLVRWPFT
jgi:hypothetical protein